MAVLPVDLHVGEYSCDLIYYLDAVPLLHANTVT